MKYAIFFLCLLLFSCSTKKEQNIDKNEPGADASSDAPFILKFDVGQGPAATGYQAVTASDTFNTDKGFGWVSAFPLHEKSTTSKDTLNADIIYATHPFYFFTDIPEGNYKVTVTLGNPDSATNTTIKAESRRLMLEDIHTEPGEYVTKHFNVNVRFASINGTDSIRLKSREYSYLNWDNKLSLEFNGVNPSVSSIEITEIQDSLPVIFLAGNSTVVDQNKEPWASWGQMITRFFNDEVVVANLAESGETLKSFRREKRLNKVLSMMKAGDYLFIEFAHNDQKPGGNHVDPFTTYQDELRYFIDQAQKKGAHPVLVTSMHRRSFDSNGTIINTLEDYPEAMRQLSTQLDLPLIDLNAMSKLFYEALGEEKSKKAFVHYPAHTFPGQEEALADNTHFCNYGAYELARCIVNGIKSEIPALAQHLRKDIPDFDPAQPTPPEKFDLPMSPSFTNIKPDGF